MWQKYKFATKCIVVWDQNLTKSTLAKEFCFGDNIILYIYYYILYYIISILLYIILYYTRWVEKGNNLDLNTYVRWIH